MQASPDPMREPAAIPRWQRLLLPGAMRERPDGRRSPRDWVVDVAMFLLAVAIGGLVLDGTWSDHTQAEAIVDLVLGTVACALLWRRRQQPVAVVVATTVLAAVSGLAAGAALLALFSAAIRLPVRVVAAVAALALASTATFPLLYPGKDAYGTQLLVGCLLAIVVVGWGLFVQAQRELIRSLHERTRRAEDEQRQRVDQAREAERLRIAREMHDALAHRVSLLSLHAGALEYHPDAPPEEIAEAAGVIRATAHAVLQDLRDVIGVLRDGSAPAGAVAPEPPQPTLARIPMLVEESRAAGMRVRLALALPDEAVAASSDALGRTAYRVVQEGLTNARKHAPGATVAVAVRADGAAAGAGGANGGAAAAGASGASADRAPSRLAVEVVSRRPVGGARRSPAADLPGTGIGLVGLAERVALAGGELTHGRDASGDFVLRATLPWTP